MAKQRALIIGGSVGGLFAANLLRSVGWDAVVFERNPEELTGPRRRHQHASAAACRHASGSASRSTMRWASASTASCSSTTTAAPTTGATPSA